MKAVLVIDKPESCTSCLLGIYNKKWFCLKTNKDIDIADRYHTPSWCPLSHPLKSVSSDFYIYDRKFLFDHLDREIELLQSTKRFEEYMKARKQNADK